MQEKIAKLMFNLFWWPVRALLSFFLSLEVESKENLEKLKGPLIVASDHHSFLDAFLIGASFPRNAKIFPIRYGTWHKYYYFPLLFPIIRAFGAFPIFKGNMEKALQPGVEVLKSGGTVGIFPEGKRRYLGRPPKARRGVAYLALKTNSPILPIHIEVKFGITILQFFLRRHKARVIIGEKFYLPKRKIIRREDLNEPADFVMEKIRSLYPKNKNKAKKSKRGNALYFTSKFLYNK